MLFSLLIALAMDLKDLLYIAGIILGASLGTAAIGGALWYRFSDGFSKKKLNAAKEWREIAESQSARIDDLAQQGKTWKHAHEVCEGKINTITQFNLRLQARERGYQRTINRLEIKAGLEPTDFNDITDAAPSFDT